MPANTAMPIALTHFAAGAAGDHQRHDAHDEGEGGHQDGTQSQPASFDRRRDDVHAAFDALACELDDQDRVLAGKPDQNDEADLRQDVVVGAGQPHAEHRRQQAHGHDEDDRERQRPAFVLRGENQEDEQHAQREYERRDIGGGFLLISEIRPFIAEFIRQRVAQDSLHCGAGLAGGVPRRRLAVDVGGEIDVVVRDAIRPGREADRCDRSERDHVAVGVACLELGDILGMRTKARLGLCVDAEGSTETIEVVHVRRAEV